MRRLHVAAGLAGLLAMALLLGGCAAEGVGVAAGYDEDYWGGPTVDYDMDFDEPFGFGYGYGYGGFDYGYGGWGPGYFVGPPAWGYGAPVEVGGGLQRPYRPAPPSRPLPSIPVGPRGPGTRGLPR